MSEALEASSSAELNVIERWPTARAKIWLGSFLEAARREENIVAIVAVGSAIRRGTVPVDLDLVVLAKDVAELKLKPPIEVDLRAYPINQVDSLIANGADLIGWAITFGKVLFQRHSSWDQIVGKWKGRVPLPSVEVAGKRANEALRRFKNMGELEDQDAAFEQALSYVTHRARAELVKRGVYPASRPELPGQLREVGAVDLADALQRLVARTDIELPALVAMLDQISTR